jgi:hypothetical protein
MDLLSLVGNVASVLGLLVSVWVMKQVSDVKRQYLRQVRSPALLERLKEQEQRLSKLLLPSTLDTEQVRLVLASSESLLRNLRPKLTGSESKQVKSMISRVSRARTGAISRDVAVHIRADLVSIIDAATEQHKDTQWTH